VVAALIIGLLFLMLFAIPALFGPVDDSESEE
jgi:hypothetical protein